MKNFLTKKKGDMVTFVGDIGSGKSSHLKLCVRDILETGASVLCWSAEEGKQRFISGIKKTGIRGNSAEWLTRCIWWKPILNKSKKRLIVEVLNKYKAGKATHP